MACEIFSAVMVWSWSVRFSLAGGRLAGVTLGGGVGNNDNQGRLHLSWKLS